LNLSAYFKSFWT